MRQSKQILADYYAVVYLFDCVNGVSSIDGNLKIQKLLFLHEFEGIRGGLKSNHYKYFRHNQGPYSKDLANDVASLEKIGLVNRASRKLTKRGKIFLEYFRPEVDRIIGVTLHIAEDVCREFGRLSGPQLVNHVYRMRVPVYDFGGVEATVRDIPSFTDIFDPLHDQSTKELDTLDEVTIKQMEEQLAITPEQLDSSNVGFKQAVNERLERAFS
jgi:uncharacterized protein YwgA